MKTIVSLASAAAVAATFALGAAWAQTTNDVSTPQGGALSSTAGSCNTATGNALAAGNLGGPGIARGNPCATQPPVAAVVVPPAPVAVVPVPAPAAPAPVAVAPQPAPAPEPQVAAAPVPQPQPAAPAQVRVARADRN
jgi:hypothetical protein